MLMKNMKVLKWWFIIALLCLIPQLTFAQNIQVQGSITDEMGETMIGVSVLIKGTAMVQLLIRMVILHCRFLLKVRWLFLMLAIKLKK